jgi:hypothetical protein
MTTGNYVWRFTYDLFYKDKEDKALAMYGRPARAGAVPARAQRDRRRPQVRLHAFCLMRLALSTNNG